MSGLAVRTFFICCKFHLKDAIKAKNSLDMNQGLIIFARKEDYVSNKNIANYSNITDNNRTNEGGWLYVVAANTVYLGLGSAICG